MRKHFFRLSSAAVLLAGSLLAQDYKLETVSSAAPNLPAPYAALIQSTGYRINGPSGPWCEIWFRKSIPSSPKSKDDAIVLPIAQGTLIGILRFPAAGYDRRGQPIKPGVYTLRYSLYPVDGAHQGVAPQRDFALLTPLSADPDPATTPAYESLIESSIKGVGTPHPTVLSLASPTATTFPTLTKDGESDWILTAKLGDLPISIILVGKVEA